MPQNYTALSENIVCPYHKVTTAQRSLPPWIRCQWMRPPRACSSRAWLRLWSSTRLVSAASSTNRITMVPAIAVLGLVFCAVPCCSRFPSMSRTVAGALLMCGFEVLKGPEQFCSKPICPFTGAAMLEVQPGMADAAAADVLAALAAGLPMHKAWIKAAKRPSSGSNRSLPFLIYLLFTFTGINVCC